MKITEVKLVHIAIAVIFFLIALAMLRWVQLPHATPPAPVPATATGQTEELPVLPQNELYNSAPVPSFLEDSSLVEERSQENNDASKGPPMTAKPEL